MMLRPMANPDFKDRLPQEPAEDYICEGQHRLHHRTGRPIHEHFPNPTDMMSDDELRARLVEYCETTYHRKANRSEDEDCDAMLDTDCSGERKRREIWSEGFNTEFMETDPTLTSPREPNWPPKPNIRGITHEENLDRLVATFGIEKSDPAFCRAWDHPHGGTPRYLENRARASITNEILSNDIRLNDAKRWSFVWEDTDITCDACWNRMTFKCERCGNRFPNSHASDQISDFCAGCYEAHYHMVYGKDGEKHE